MRQQSLMIEVKTVHINQSIQHSPIAQPALELNQNQNKNAVDLQAHDLNAGDMRAASNTNLSAHNCNVVAIKPQPQIEDTKLQVEFCAKPSNKDIDAAMSILKDTIPAEELGDTDILKGQIQRNEQQLILAKSDKSVVGTAVVRTLPQAESALVNYLAVDKACHSKGYGSKILKQLDNAFMASRPDIKHLLLEIEPYDAKADPKDNKVKRANFYHRAGYSKVDVNYCGINRVDGKPIDYFLMHKPIQRTPVMPINSPRVATEHHDFDLQQALKSILTENYQVKDQLGSLMGRILEPTSKAA